MTETPYATGTAETAPAPDVGDNPRYDEVGPSGGYGRDTDAFAAEDQLPARQDSHAANWGDSPEYDETGLTAEYDGDQGALTGEDQLPARQESRDTSLGEHPEYDEAGLGAGYDGDDANALAAGDRLPARQVSHAAAWGDDPGYYDETDLAAGYDGDLDALTGEDHALDTGKGDQDQAADDDSPAIEKPVEPLAEVSGAVASEREDGNVTADESSPAGAAADSGSAAETETGERLGETAQAGRADALTRQAAQPDDGHADSDAAPDAGLKELKAEFETSMKELRAELQALKDGRQAAPDAPGNTEREADQPYKSGLPVDQKNRNETEHKEDRPGLWSNAKTALYGAIGTTVTLALADQFVPGAPHPVVDMATGAVSIVAALVPTMREGWKRKHDNSPDKH